MCAIRNDPTAYFPQWLKAAGADAVEISTDLMTMETYMRVVVGNKVFGTALPDKCDPLNLQVIFTETVDRIKELKTIAAVKQRLKGTSWPPA